MVGGGTQPNGETGGFNQEFPEMVRSHRERFANTDLPTLIFGFSNCFSFHINKA